ncbi:hypothetical protein BA895_11945 [Humibacillus sp. DSM 29435]|uniref:type II toxin-antitoxin system Phd/YefM family antitoxin n=1 Tax=Humibacillus sp. DSM 29435 TaxID=1869167 RepID=UPI0008723FF0|nr:type II toxin-antitoxin system Phd/YefM family antitoxin [Humibacillus sp. DSM 29435]OFE18344.1 hypothetical protein BA895_11945 [Humibacillus sp. DSM 29435]
MNEEIPVTEARSQFSELVNRVGFGKERIVLTRHGKPLVALVPAEMLDQHSAEQTEANATAMAVHELRSSGADRPQGYPIAAQHRESPPA